MNGQNGLSPDTHHHAHGVASPPRVLGQLDATNIVVGAIVGVGIFFAPSRVAELAGTAPLALAAWALAGAIALLGALTFAELGSRYHASGAQYQILRDAYGTWAGFCYVLCNATAIQAGAIAVISVVCVENLALAAGAAPPRGWPLAGLAALLTLGITAANVVGVRWGARIQNVTVAAKILTIAGITLLALFASPATDLHAAPRRGDSNGLAGVLAGLLPAFFAYGGWQHALWISGEVRDPARNVPRAIIAGAALVVVVYLMANIAYLRLLGVAGVKTSAAVAADAVGAVLPQIGRSLFAAAVAVSALGVLNAQLLSGPRLLFGIARDGQFFVPLGRLHPRFGTPAAAILLLGAMGVVILAISTAASVSQAGEKAVNLILAGAVSIDGAFFALTGAALIVLRRKGLVNASEGFRAPGYPIVPVLFVIGAFCIFIGAFLAHSTRNAGFVGLGWMTVSLLIYAAATALRAQAPKAPVPDSPRVN